ncbi:hypothetical protein HMPREF3103_08665 [Granulicatella sp. HMSC30F09]|jgi:mcrBC 5-methylcytosine restriction system component|uniref:McrC family protein n=3 Tax=Granulicatella TaxID=117563 RepID=UPI00066CA4A8|nr:MULTISPECIES: McrC family protein [unclassified Granulicatella]OFT78480.1 hypothetical protein HMPREF3103_08665 [Granulicatella sp. HMSC30F09]
MNDKLLSIKEFEFITSNNSYAETGDNIHYLSERYFKELDDFIRNQESTDDEGNPLDFLRARTVKGIGNVIQAKNFVGLIQLESGCQIQILPKVDFGTNDTGKTTEEVFIDMLKTMKDFPGKVFSSANLRTESVNLYEIFINMYLYQLSLLTRKGLKSAYISQEDTLNVFKGKLLVNRHLKENIGHAERFSLAYDEFNLNRPENRLIKSTLLKLQKISTSSNNLKSIRQQLIYFDLVAPSWNYASDFDEVQIDRTTKDYEEILAWSKVFLMNKSFSIFSGDNKARALLFPMEKVYESFVSMHIVDIFEREHYSVSTQDTGRYLLKEENRNIFSLRPDIVVKDKEENTIIMDTKWKRLYDSPQENYGISQTDMYQMYAYSKKYNANKVWVLYPRVNELENRIIEFRDEDTKIHIFFVDVSEIKKSIKELLREIKA